MIPTIETEKAEAVPLPTVTAVTEPSEPTQNKLWPNLRQCLQQRTV